METSNGFGFIELILRQPDADWMIFLLCILICVHETESRLPGIHPHRAEASRYYLFLYLYRFIYRGYFYNTASIFYGKEYLPRHNILSSAP